MHIRSLLLANCAMLAVSGICFAPAAEGGSGAPAEVTNGDAMGQRQLTRGELRVGLTFNPSGDSRVTVAKQHAAYCIDDCLDAMDAANAEGNKEAARCFATAATAYEDAAMWQVKAITKPKA